MGPPLRFFHLSFSSLPYLLPQVPVLLSFVSSVPSWASLWLSLSPSPSLLFALCLFRRDCVFFWTVKVWLHFSILVVFPEFLSLIQVFLPCSHFLLLTLHFIFHFFLTLSVFFPCLPFSFSCVIHLHFFLFCFSTTTSNLIVLLTISPIVSSFLP